jgi:hypothetical protein
LQIRSFPLMSSVRFSMANRVVALFMLVVMWDGVRG